MRRSPTRLSIRRLALGVSAGTLLATLTASTSALADGSVVMWPAMTPAGDDPGTLPMHRPAEAEQTVFARAQELDATLRDAAQDLGFTLHVGDAGPLSGHTRDSDMLERASHAGAAGPSAGTWVVSPRLEYAGGDTFIVRIVAVPPKGRELRVRVETVKGADVSVRGLVMLRDVMSAATAARAAVSARELVKVDDVASYGVMSPLRSPGRPVLAVNAALFGAYVAYSVQRASGNDDPRVLYPLLALGTGVGIGASLLAAEEWNVGTGDAWFLSGGAWWGAAAGVFIANGRHVQPLNDRYAWGVGGGFLGLGLGVFALTRSHIDEGDAVIVNSGGAFGMALGGLGELFYRGTTVDFKPYTGAGYGAGIGVVSAGVLATFVRASPSRVMLVDLGAGLGGLGGAALASPLLFEDVTPGKARGFLAATAGATIGGGALVLYLTRNIDKKEQAWHYGAPNLGVIGSSATPEGNVPAYGMTWRGSF